MSAAELRRPILFAFVAGSAFISFFWTRNDTLGYQDTPVIPGTHWHVHDGFRPQPPIVKPSSSDSKPIPAPTDAMVLFEGKSLGNFQSENGTPARWTLKKGTMVANGTRNIVTKETFGDCHLHIEWATPATVTGSGQGRGNSGVFLMGRFEIQILDSFANPTYPDGQAGAVYGQTPPLVNASRKPGEWQEYEIFFTAPRFVGNSLQKPASVTVYHNGVLVQDHTVLLGETVHAALPRYQNSAETGPLLLQDHHCPVRFRNIWIRKL